MRTKKPTRLNGLLTSVSSQPPLTIAPHVSIVPCLLIPRSPNCNNSGNYGVVRLGKILGTHDFVAVKLEPATTRAPTLEKEWLFYTNKIGVARGFPKAHYFGQVTFPGEGYGV